MRVLAVVFAALAAAVAASEEELPSIYGMQALKITCDSKSKFDFVVQHHGERGYDFLRVPRALNSDIEVLVAAEQIADFKAELAARAINFEVLVADASKVIERELGLNRRARMMRARSAGISLKAFPRYDEIKAYVENLTHEYGDFVSMFTIGQSYEGRDIVGAKFSAGPGDKPALLIDAGIHAREWIAPTTALYAIKQLAENSSTHYLFDNIDIYIIPVLNPDGYEYTQQSPSTRMWRKTRSKTTRSCTGVDANRNFGLEWMTVGASSNPCSDIYAGTEAFSEPETAALRDFVLGLKSVKTYLTFHSYGQYLLHPWGFTSKLPSNEPILRCVAEKAESELSKLRGTHYEIGSSTNVLYAASGGSDDWVMGVGGADLSYTVELPGGYFGFAPPPREIIPVGRETFEAIKVFAKYTEGNLAEC
ncbi:carboxypeptidase B-like [Phymastichus coffea]|uniref:carboxypeptidase B-like n=1 Tax=Phymastichus coffea TaxID=108790 RepID=UPI00273AEE0B|nr:carboxypeptidase B-like [Phymastichus coffea]